VCGVDYPRLRDYLATMRLHMPPAHRAFIAALQPGGPLLRAALSCAAPGTAAAQEGYNAVLAELEVFRGQHRAMARKFIAPGATSQGLPPMGTGGTEFLPALETYRATTGAHKLKL
jgi:indoleamine 2,3-dioxygenase